MFTSKYLVPVVLAVLLLLGLLLYLVVWNGRDARRQRRAEAAWAPQPGARAGDPAAVRSRCLPLRSRCLPFRSRCLPLRSRCLPLRSRHPPEPWPLPEDAVAPAPTWTPEVGAPRPT